MLGRLLVHRHVAEFVDHDRVESAKTRLEAKHLATLPRFAVQVRQTGGREESHPVAETTRLAAKADAGAQFVQTQFCYDIGIVRRYMARLAEAGLTGRLFILLGTGPIASAKSARWMVKNLWGVIIPDAVIERLEGAADQRAEGRKICAEYIEQVREIDGVAGVHVMAYRQEEAVAEIIDASGVLAGREPRSHEPAAAAAYVRAG